jgi:predicted GIY-YIG superfamily endonuclease|eukprot:COSAG02_NODE_2378_length_9005_cov_4.989782_6_plen_123_part_00
MSSQTLGQLECRSYVYVIECQSCDGTEHDYWYAGVSSPAHLGTRLDQHWCQRAARWTRTHRPVRVAAVHRAGPTGEDALALERQVTLDVMRECVQRHGEHGWMRVRGGPWCSENMSEPPPEL